jgi:tetratricopeptide (TPR) repeat protein
MNWPDWITDHTLQWIIGTSIAICAIIIPLVINRRHHNTPTQTQTIKGCWNIPVQINQSPGATVTINVNEIDPEDLARRLAELLPAQQTIQDIQEKDAEIQALKVTIERLQHDSASGLKQAALEALSENNIEKAKKLLKQSAISLTKQAAEDWIDIGNIAYLTDLQDALDAYQEATKLDPVSADAWNRLGHVLKRLGRLNEALKAYERVLELAGESKPLQATAYGNLGNICRTRGELEKAEEFYSKTLEIAKSLGHQEVMASTYGNLGIIYQIRGELEKAEEFHLKSLEIEKALGRQEGMASDYGNLGVIYQIRGELEKAEEFHLKSLEIEKALGWQEGMANQYGNLGVIYQIRGELEKAEEFHLKSLEINKAIGRQESMASDYGNLGVIYQIRGELEKACEYWQMGLELFSSVGAKDKAQKVSKWINDNCNSKE